MKAPTWWLKNTIPKRELKYLVPNIWATIPFVGGTVDNHSNPKEIPKTIDIMFDGGEKIKIAIDIALKA